MLAAVMLAAPALVAQELPAGPQPADNPGPSAPVTTLEIPPPILTLNQERFFQGSDWGRAAIDRAEAATAELARENRSIEVALEEEERALTTRRPGMTPADFAPLATAFDQKVEGIRAAQEAKSRAIMRQLDADQQRFFQEVRPILGTLLGERHATAIVSDSTLVISLSSLDVTDEAIRRVNAALQPEPPVALPDAPAETPENPAETPPAP